MLYGPGVRDDVLTDSDPTPAQLLIIRKKEAEERRRLEETRILIANRKTELRYSMKSGRPV